MPVTYVSGRQETVDYTPGADVAAGTVVVVGSLVGVTNLDIAANALGALSISGIFRAPKATGGGTAITGGSKVFWDAGNTRVTLTAGTNKLMGIVTPDGGGADADDSVELDLIGGRGTANQITFGAGNPNDANGSNGDVYIKTGGAGGIYVKAAGTWGASTPLTSA